MSNNMKNDVAVVTAAGSSPACSIQDPDSFAAFFSDQQFKKCHEGSCLSLPMDYEHLVSRPSEQDKDFEDNMVSKNRSNETNDTVRCHDEQSYRIGCDKEVDISCDGIDVFGGGRVKGCSTTDDCNDNQATTQGSVDCRVPLSPISDAYDHIDLSLGYADDLSPVGNCGIVKEHTAMDGCSSNSLSTGNGPLHSSVITSICDSSSPGGRRETDFIEASVPVMFISDTCSDNLLINTGSYSLSSSTFVPADSGHESVSETDGGLGRLINHQKSGECSVTGLSHFETGYSAHNPASSTSALPLSHGAKSATSDGVLDISMEGHHGNHATQIPLPESNKVWTTTALPFSSFTEQLPQGGKDVTGLGLSSNVESSSSRFSTNLVGLPKNEKNMTSQNPPLNSDEQQQRVLPGINTENNNVHSSVLSSRSRHISSATASQSALQATEGHSSLPTIQDSSLSASGAIPSAVEVPDSFHRIRDGPMPFAGKRHMKSFLSSYASHKSNDNYSSEDVNDIADELAHMLKCNRKRSYSAPTTSGSSSKKPCLAESDTAEMRKPLAEFDIDMDNSSSTPWLSAQTKKPEKSHGAAIVMCKVCDTSIPNLRSIQCKNFHFICKSCIEEEVRQVMASEKMYLSCPAEHCKAAITIDSLASLLSSFVVDLLRDNLRLKEHKASAKAIKKMLGLVICPRCSCPGLMDEFILKFHCPTCNSNCCRYCKGEWTNNREHQGCSLLGFVGSECLKEVSKLPANWDMKIRPFNQNFVQVDIPLTSNEGSTVAAFYAETSAKCQISQIFRIQNRKLWEKYVLKRKHVEEEIGASELKEKFLFHGTHQKNIVSICAEGFDIRVPTSNGAVLGKGIYFSTSARYSERYAGTSGMVFLARVICGWSQQGSKKLTRPAYHDKVHRMYDSCVDHVKSPTMYTVFDNSQCYPEYLIRFAN